MNLHPQKYEEVNLDLNKPTCDEFWHQFFFDQKGGTNQKNEL